MFSKILIANRGEIACRIARTAKRMGISTVAIHSDIDNQALHVLQCDESVSLGGKTATDSYLNIEKVISAAKNSGAEAIHPGYGFLSENTVFADRCQREGLVFIGPSAESIDIMGSKSHARQVVAGAGVPVVPGYDGDEQDEKNLQDHADAIGYPVLIKAVAGGGGKGMRVVESADQFAGSLGSVKRESLSAFADDRVLLEKYLPVARHVEVQVFGDRFGNVVHLYERDCSMQRRHQKVIEESPAPGLDEQTRTAMTQAAIACARSVNYLGAGTVEFLYGPDGSFYFMEMNTRLQVEHPVTEMVTGLDLVEWQLRVAAGEALPLEQDQITLQGHAMEARIYAENSEQQFLPATGTVVHLSQPADSGWVRVDSGIKSGDEISPYYDPMISKLIVRAEDRKSAANLLSRNLGQTVVLGVRTNTGFLQRLIANKDFQQARLDTRLIERHIDPLTTPETPSALTFACACACLYRTDMQNQGQRQSGESDIFSPWTARGMHSTGAASHASFDLGSSTTDTTAHTRYTIDYANGRFSFPGLDSDFSAELDRHQLHLYLDGEIIPAAVASVDNQLYLHVDGQHYLFQVVDPLDVNQQGALQHTEAGSVILSPMPGTVIDVAVEAGQNVKAGDPLITIEAMKMEHLIRASRDGKILHVHFKKGDQVREAVTLLELES